MAIEASFTIDEADFPLSAVFEQMTDATIELDRVVPTSGAVVPYFWIYSDDSSELTTDLSEDTGVTSVRIIDRLEEQMFVRVEWNLDHESVLTAVVETDVTLLSGRGSGKRWTFEVRASEQADLSAFQAYCREHDVPIELKQLHALSPISSDQQYDLTDGQRTALELAYDRGYFDSPRGATQTDLADELNISRQAVSSRLQRGMRRLVASTLVRPGE